MPIKNILSKFWQGALLILAAGLLAASPGLAVAANITYSADTTIAISSPAVNFTILQNSVASSVVVNTTGLTVTVPAAGIFTITSSDRGVVATGYSGAATAGNSCSGSVSTFQITAAGVPETIDIGPAGSACGSSSSSSSSGGGGGGGGSAPPGPTNISVIIAAGATTTNTSSVTLTLAATNASQMMISNTADFSGGVWETFATSKAWTLTSGYGSKIVYARFKDSFGNVSSVVSDTIAVPTPSGTIPATPATPAVPGVSPAIPATPAIPGAHFNGTLVLDGKTVYLIKDGKRYGFRNADEYKSHGYNFGQVVAANAQDKAMPQAEFVEKALEGTLVLDAADGKTVYMIGTGGTKRGFSSAGVFKALGYSFANLPKIHLGDYPAGQAIISGSDTHPDGALVLDGKTVWWVLGGTRQGFESMAVFKTYGFSSGKIVKGNLADLALPQGPPVKFRNGTLVKDSGNYYIISDGKKIGFASAAVLAAKGYKTSNAISAGLANYESGGNIQ